MNEQPAVVYEGSNEAAGQRFALVCARFNEPFVLKLLEGAIDCIVSHGGSAENLTVAWVPGSYEIPTIANKMAATGKYDAVIGLGVVMKGATCHADNINTSVAAGLMDIAMRTGVPVIDGVIGAETVDQAIERSGGKEGNRGYSGALAAIQMASLIKALDEGSS